jgi:hypothetical protein
MPYRLNQYLICLGLGSLSKGLGTNLKFLTNKIVQFHWTPLLGPLSKVALSVWLIDQMTIQNFENKKIPIDIKPKYNSALVQLKCCLVN